MSFQNQIIVIVVLYNISCAKLFVYAKGKAGVRFNSSFKLLLQGYFAGGAGYVLGREALKRFVVDGMNN